MEIREHHVPFHLPLAKTYVEQFSRVERLFEYDPKVALSFSQRQKDLIERDNQLKCDRTQIVEALLKYNQGLSNHDNSLQNINRLLDPQALVVVGGQQPGLLTGPLYSVYKIFTILQVAKREQVRLGVPVIPIFWIAGEDHDWDEVNHLYALTEKDTVKKKALAAKVKGRSSLSHIPLHKDEVRSYIQHFLETQPFTENSQSLHDLLVQQLEMSSNYSDFFARLLITLFGQDGLVLLDSTDPNLRQLEGEMFARILAENEAMAQHFQASWQMVSELGYTPQVENNPKNAYLFLYEGEERILLEREGEQFRLRHGNRQWRKEELIDLALSHPNRFSCNVVTRPLMQEYLLPVLAFIGGPGEVSYWALYRSIFQHFGMKMPIIIPRETFTLTERHVQKLQEEYQLSFDDLINKLDEHKERWLIAQDDQHIKEEFAHIQDQITNLYQPLKEKLNKIDPHLTQMQEKNLSIILNQVRYLEKKTHQVFERRHRTVLKQFDRAKLSLIPEGKPQERVYNLFTYINQYGWGWWEELKSLPFEVNGLHKEIRI